MIPQDPAQQKVIFYALLERDIDMLMVEESISSHSFVEFLLEQTDFNPNKFKCVSASPSVADADGESDIEVILVSDNGTRLNLMIENKITAGLQHEQAERYRQRGENKKINGMIDHYLTILIAPERYCANSTRGFDYHISYEKIMEWFESSTLSAERKFYKIALLKAGIEKGTHGYQFIADSAVTSFWKDYWSLVNDLAPELGMPEPGNKPSSASFIYFKNPCLPRGVRLLHKLTQGNFDIQFKELNSQSLQSRYQALLSPNMLIAKASRSASIRLKVPTISVNRPVTNQRDEITAALQAGKQLLDWVHKHLPLVSAV